MKTLSRVLVVTADTLGTRMAGPAIRAFEIAKALAPVTQVRLVSTASSTLSHSQFEIQAATNAEMILHERWADVIVFQGHLLASHPWLKRSDKIIVADIYDPMHLEQLEQSRQLTNVDRHAGSAAIVEVLNDQLSRADFLICASEKQRDFWLGALGALGRINPASYDEDESLRSLLAVVPFGVEDAAPVQRSRGIKGSVPGIEEDDKVVIWGGGIYNWFDPLTLIRAIHRLSLRRPDVRLFFLGVTHPNPEVPAMRMAFQARELAAELGVLDRAVFFNDGWVPYDERADFLLDADVGVSTHLDHLETAFSFRTRILDYLWASLPIVSTDGDTFAGWISENGLGRTVPAGDIGALERALEDLLYDDELRLSTSRRVGEFAENMRWSKVLTPLIDFCLAPSPARDRRLGIEPLQSAAIQRLSIRVKGLEDSTSWRYTAPFRFVSSRVQRVSRGLARRRRHR